MARLLIMQDPAAFRMKICSPTSRKCRRPPQNETCVAFMLPGREHECNGSFNSHRPYCSLAGATSAMKVSNWEVYLMDKNALKMGILDCICSLMDKNAFRWLGGLLSRCIVARARLGDRSYRMHQLRCRTRVGKSITL
ncbi:hypothetical protein Tco_1441893 [Tanacetum coccineum]